MDARETAYLRAQQQRWLRCDAHAWVRPDAAKFLKPGTDPADVYPALLSDPGVRRESPAQAPRDYGLVSDTEQGL